MSRYRPPPEKSSPYITAVGQARLQNELRYLWKEKRPEVTQKVSEAAALGDRSENAEYIYGKRQLAEIDRRIRYLSKRLDELNVVDRAPPDTSKVYFGAWVDLESEDGEAMATVVQPRVRTRPAASLIGRGQQLPQASGSSPGMRRVPTSSLIEPSSWDSR